MRFRLVTTAVALLLPACSGSSAPATMSPPIIAVADADEKPAAPKNVVFTARRADPGTPPAARLLDLPELNDPTGLGRPTLGSAVWGATGRDHRGRVYVGVTVDDPA